MGFWKDEEHEHKICKLEVNPAGWWSAEQAEFTQSIRVMRDWEQHGVTFKPLYYGKDLYELEK